MNSIFFLALLSTLGVTLLSLLGIGFFLTNERTISRILLYLVSFSTGALLGDVFIHMLPEMATNQAFFPSATLIILGGILFSFVVEKVIHWRHCHILEHGHEHHHPVGFLSLVGEGIHNFIDGIVIAASFLTSIPVGIATTFAIIFHEIPHEIGNYAILLHSGYKRKKALLLNFGSGMFGILGTVLVFAFSGTFTFIADYLLPFAAGNLLYIAGSDLIPELHKSTKLFQSIVQFILMIAGMGLMYLVLFLE